MPKLNEVDVLRLMSVEVELLALRDDLLDIRKAYGASPELNQRLRIAADRVRQAYVYSLHLRERHSDTSDVPIG